MVLVHTYVRTNITYYPLTISNGLSNKINRSINNLMGLNSYSLSAKKISRQFFNTFIFAA